MTTTKRITGGRDGFRNAIREAFFKSKCHDPEVRYSHSRGFHVESKHTPPDENVLWRKQAYTWANTGERSMLVSHYPEVRNEIFWTEKWRNEH
jgi:hypothetical protein